jgi:hypothetical protein
VQRTTYPEKVGSTARTVTTVTFEGSQSWFVISRDLSKSLACHMSVLKAEYNSTALILTVEKAQYTDIGTFLPKESG